MWVRRYREAERQLYIYKRLRKQTYAHACMQACMHSFIGSYIYPLIHSYMLCTVAVVGLEDFGFWAWGARRVLDFVWRVHVWGL